jgi:hypothetical protein
LFIRPAFASTSSVTFCFKRVRFKKQGTTSSSDPTTDPDNVDFAVGEVTVSPTGNTLGTFSLAAGDYRRLELDLENQCSSGKSIVVTNSNGTFSTNSRVTIRFDGTFTMGTADTTLGLAVKGIVDALATVNADNGVAPAATSVNGTF